jgi:hypothetical protein
MPKYLRNWTFDDIAEFLKQNHFLLRNIEGSHHYFVVLVDGIERVCHVQRHTQGAIPPKTLKINIIEKSGIPEELWIQWTTVSSSQRKKIVYEKAQKREFPETAESPSTAFKQTKGEEVNLD